MNGPGRAEVRTHLYFRVAEREANVCLKSYWPFSVNA